MNKFPSSRMFLFACMVMSALACVNRKLTRPISLVYLYLFKFLLSAPHKLCGN